MPIDDSSIDKKCDTPGCNNRAICLKNTICVKCWRNKYMDEQLKKQNADDTDDSTAPTNEAKDEKKKAPVVRGNKVEGILDVAKNMVKEGRENKEILETLIAMYIKAGRDPKKAKHNAQSAIFNARKKIGGG